MNINVQTLALAKRNILANDSNSVGTQIPEELKMDPEKKDGEVLMDSLEIQGKNNMAFRSSMSNKIAKRAVKQLNANKAPKMERSLDKFSVSVFEAASGIAKFAKSVGNKVKTTAREVDNKIGNSLENGVEKVRKVGLALILASLFAKCMDVNQTVTVEMDAVLTEIRDIMNDMHGDNQRYYDLLQAMYNEMLNQSELEESQNEIMKQVLQALLDNEQYQATIIELLTQNGMTLEQILAMDPSEAVNIIIGLLSNISNNIENILNQLQTMAENIENRFAALLEKVENIEQNIAAIRADITALRADHQELLAKINQINISINKLRNDVNSNFASVIQRLEANTAEVAGLKAIVEQGLQAHNMTLEQFIALYNQNESAARNLLLQILNEQQAQNQHEAEQTSWLINIYGAIQNLPDDVFERIVPPIVNAINGLGNDMNLNLGEISDLLGQLVEFTRNHHNHPDYDAKLDRIIELLQQYLNSDDEEQNEGVRNELGNIFDGMSK